MKKIDFYFGFQFFQIVFFFILIFSNLKDIVCPFALMGSIKLKRIAQQHKNIQINWIPVLLGGLYNLTKAPQVKLI